MKTYIHAQGFEIWQSFVDEYKETTVPPTNERAIKIIQNNSKAKNALLNGLCEPVYTKFNIVNPLKIFGRRFKTFMKDIQNSKQ
jgi:hypothetical protein